jgi:hypothetical protein
MASHTRFKEWKLRKASKSEFESMTHRPEFVLLRRLRLFYLKMDGKK